MRRTSIYFQEADEIKLKEIKDYIGTEVDREAVQRALTYACKIIKHIKNNEKILVEDKQGKIRELEFT